MALTDRRSNPHSAADDRAFGEVVERLAREAGVVTPAVSGCELAVVPLGGGGPAGSDLVRANSNNFASAIAAIQREVGEGPSTEVMATAARVAVADMDAEPVRWPAFTVAARARGLRTVHAEPLVTPDRALVGVITWYAKVPGLFGIGDRADLISRAHACTYTVALARRYLDLQLAPQDLAAALDSRTVISRAVGILMEHHRCDSASAFARLRTTATTRGMAVHIYAPVLVDRATRDQRVD